MPTPLKRQIGFKKPPVQQLPAPAPKKKQVSSPKAPESSVDKKESVVTLDQVISWIKAHPLFKWAAMCKEIGIDAGNFSRTMNGDGYNIKPAMLDKMVKTITEYGFRP